MSAGHAKWRQRGAVYVWRFDRSRNCPGWHLAADSAGASSLAELLDLFGLSVHPARAWIVVSPPGPPELAVPNNVGGRAEAPSRLEMCFLPGSNAAATLWEAEELPSVLRFRFGATRLGELRAGIAAIRSGRGDFSVGGPARDARLWFWWRAAAADGGRP
jgi:hypothetical protein